MRFRHIPSKWRRGMADGIMALDTNSAALGELTLPSGSANGRYGSDVIVDLLKQFQIPYAALNPGAGYRVAMTEPQGPVYLCYDAQLQEDPLDREIRLPSPNAARVPTRMAADSTALDRLAELLMNAERPVILAEYLGRDHAAVRQLVRLAETLAVPVVDVNARHNFPSNHPLNMTHTNVLDEADLLLALDVRDLERPTTRLESASRKVQSRLPADCVFAEIGFADLELSSWSMDYGRYQETSLSVLADTSLAVPALADMVAERLAADLRKQESVAVRRAAMGLRHAAARARWQ